MQSIQTASPAQSSRPGEHLNRPEGFREHPERIFRGHTREQLQANGRKGGQLGASTRIERAHARAVRRLLLDVRVDLTSADLPAVERLCRAVAKSCYWRGYTAGRRAKARRDAAPAPAPLALVPLSAAS